MRNKLIEVTEGTQNQLPKNLYRKQLSKSSFQRKIPDSADANYQPAHVSSEPEGSFEEHVINKKENINIKNDWPYFT